MEYNMSNQRPAKTHNAAMSSDGNVSLRSIITFFEDCENALEKNKNTDAAFYFGQVKEYLTQNPHKAFNEKCETILGL